MRRTAVVAIIAVLLTAPHYELAAQQTIPIRPLGPVVAKTAEPFGIVSGVRGIPGGKVFVNDPLLRRFWLLDSSLKKVVAVADTAGTTTLYTTRGAGVVKYMGDSTLYIDPPSGSMLVLDPAGTVARVMAPPKATDIFLLTSQLNGPLGVVAGNPMAAIDAKGQLVYRARFVVPFKPPAPGQPNVQTQPDSAPLVRGNFETRVVDTLATIRIANFGTQSMTQSGASTKVKLVFNPIQINDDWAVLNDGTIAIVRSQDYHIDWIDPDGTKRSTPKMPFDWRRISDEEKKHYSDSTVTWLQHLVDSMLKTVPPAQRGQFVPEVTVPPVNEIPDYLSPIGNVRADFAGNLWILPTTSAQAKNGLLYDVVNKKGVIVERVQFPPGRSLEGFGPGGEVYLSLKEGGQTYLERARLK